MRCIWACSRDRYLADVIAQLRPEFRHHGESPCFYPIFYPGEFGTSSLRTAQLTYHGTRGEDLRGVLETKPLHMTSQPGHEEERRADSPGSPSLGSDGAADPTSPSSSGSSPLHSDALLPYAIAGVQAVQMADPSVAFGQVHRPTCRARCDVRSCTGCAEFFFRSSPPTAASRP